MNQGPPHDLVESNSGGLGKWLLGAAAAAIVVGGGYFAWTTFAPSVESDQSAYYEPLEGPDAAAPASRYADNAAPPAEELAAPTADTPPPTRASAPTRPRASTPVAAPVPEEIVGVTPANTAALEEDGEDIVVTARRPTWTRTPSARRLATLYPARALERGREGEARLRCTILQDGALDCVRAEETRIEFGAAALRVARGYRHSTTLRNGGDAVGTPVNLRVVFRMEEENRRYASR